MIILTDKKIYAFGNKDVIELPTDADIKDIYYNYSSHNYDYITKEIILPDTVERLTTGCFSELNKLEKINIPKSIKEIGSSVFWNDINLTQISDIPYSVEYIGSSAFAETKLKGKIGKYKATYISMHCRDYQLELGSWSEPVWNPELLKRGYHFVTNPFDIFNYYYGTLGKDFRVFEVETKGETNECHGDSKRVCSSIRLTREISKNELIDLLNYKGDD